MRKESVIERYLGEGQGQDEGGRGREDEEHHAEMGDEHHESVVNHLDVIGRSLKLAQALC